MGLLRGKASSGGSALKKPPTTSQGTSGLVAPEPKTPEYLSSIVEIFIEYIAVRDRGALVILSQGGSETFPVGDTLAQEEFLTKYIRYMLDKIAAIEYRKWMNGRMPFVVPRDVQLWRLYMFCRHIWRGRLPRHEHLGILFNLTPRRASGLLTDFFARFRKRFLFPIFLRQILQDLEEADEFTGEWQKAGDREGKWVVLRDTWHRAEMEALIVDPIVKKKLKKPHHRIITDPNHPGEMFVTQEIMKAVLAVREELEAAYPLLQDDDE